MQDTINNASAAVSTLFLGHNGEWWDLRLIWSVVFAALAAIAIGVTTAGSIVAHKREAAESDRELARFKLETTKEISDANARAAEAQLELAKLKEPRKLSDEQIARIKEKVKFFEGQHFSVITYWNLKEPTDLAKRIGDDALISSGWQYDKPPNGESFIGMVTGVEIELSDTSPNLAKEAAKALSKALEAEGIDAPIRNEPTYTTLIKLSVGIKP